MALVRELVRSRNERAVWPGELPSARVDLLESLWPFGNVSSLSDSTVRQLSAVWRAQWIIANSCAGMPLRCHERTSTGRREIRDTVSRVIWGRPNLEVNHFTFWATVFLHLSNGNAYIHVKGTPGMPTSLWPIESSRVQVGRDPKTRQKTYLIDGVTPAVDWSQGGTMIHLMMMSTDGLKGTSPIQAGAMSFDTALASERWANRWFKNSSAPGGYLSTEQDLTPEQSAQIAESWEEFHKGDRNAHTLAVLGKGTKWMSTTLSPKDAMIIDARSRGVIEVSNWYGLPPFMLGEVEKQSSWGTGVDAQYQGLLQFTLDSYLVNVEQTVSDDMMSNPNRYAKFVRGALLRMNPKDQAAVLEVMLRNGAASQDEWRELIDWDPIPDGQGEKFWMMTNMAPIETITGPAGAPAASESPAAAV